MKKPAKKYVVPLFLVLGIALLSFQNPHLFRATLDSWREFFTWHHWRNPLHDVLFAAQVVPGLALLVYAAVDSFRLHRKKQAHAKAKADWYLRLAALVDTEDDIEDRDDLFGYFEPSERQQLLDQLRRMPKGSRSLRKAVAIVDPDFF
jgi:hypothetical protein